MAMTKDQLEAEVARLLALNTELEKGKAELSQKAELLNVALADVKAELELANARNAELNLALEALPQAPTYTEELNSFLMAADAPDIPEALIRQKTQAGLDRASAITVIRAQQAEDEARAASEEA